MDAVEILCSVLLQRCPSLAGGKQTSGGLQDHLEWSQMENLGSPWSPDAASASLTVLSGRAGAFSPLNSSPTFLEAPLARREVFQAQDTKATAPCSPGKATYTAETSM